MSLFTDSCTLCNLFLLTVCSSDRCKLKICHGEHCISFSPSLLPLQGSDFPYENTTSQLFVFLSLIMRRGTLTSASQQQKTLQQWKCFAPSGSCFGLALIPRRNKNPNIVGVFLKDSKMKLIIILLQLINNKVVKLCCLSTSSHTRTFWPHVHWRLWFVLWYTAKWTHLGV